MNNFGFIRAICLCSGMVLSCLTLTAHAQPAGSTSSAHSGMAHSADAKASASTKAFQKEGEKMMKDMNRPYTGDADKDFVSNMIPHHQGAVNMAKIELQHGKDPELRKMARDIIKSQQQELAFMKKWQSKQGVK